MPVLSKAIRKEFLETCARIEYGRLRVKTPEGDVHDFGNSGPEGEIEIHDWSVVSSMAARGDVGLGEAYVAGLWDTPSIEQVISIALKNLETFSTFANPSNFNRLKFLFVDRLMRRNSVTGASKNIRSHYDVGNEFYQLWLDPSMTYSSALFEEGETDLQAAQLRKYDRVLSKLGSGEGVLEIGCGWGGFAERAAHAGRHVTGLTISPSQRGFAEARLDGQADIQLRDYRDVNERFDNIVSIEMIEAVGEKYWPNYFSTIKNCLADQGRAMVQAITVPDSYFSIYRRSSDYIRQYTFPGGMLLSNAKIEEQANKAGLKVCENFAFGASYAETCRRWAQELRSQSEAVFALGHDRAFLRNWLFYLEICAASFAVGQTDVVQVELAHV